MGAAGLAMTMTTEQDDLLEANGVWLLKHGASSAGDWQENPALHFRCADERAVAPSDLPVDSAGGSAGVDGSGGGGTHDEL